jgi:predicted flap endonuclease-1-like 5' DNA nuclease
MAFFKKKPKLDEQEGKEFEETLVATEPEPPTTGAVLTEEPVAPEPEPYMARTEIPDQRETEFPAEVQPYLRQDARGTILLEKYFDRPTKLNMESRVTPAPRQALEEKTWHPAHKFSIDQIRREVDRLKVRQVKPGKWIKTQFRPVFTTTKRAAIPANILAKRIVYETEGGFVIEVTFREGAETRKTFFTISSKGGRTKALSQVQSGRYALQTTVPDTILETIHPPKRGESLPYPPGKIMTYPITNESDVIEIEGIGDVYARRLHELGIHTTDQLRLMNATVIANNLGTSPATVENWQAMAELLIVDGIGKQLAEVLVRAGVKGIDALKTSKPKALAKQVNEANTAGKNRITGASLRPKRAESLIKNARKLKKNLQGFPVVEI